MQRIDGITAAPALPPPAAVSGAPGFFTGGDPAAPTAPTQVTPDWLNMIQEELVGVILAAGLPLSKVDHTQLLQAIQHITAAGIAFASDADAIASTSTAEALTPHSGRALVDSRITALVGGAPAALDTLKELADAINDDANFAATVTAALAQRVQTSRQVGTYGLLSGGGSLAGDLSLQVIAASVADYIAGTATDHALTPAAVRGAGGSNGNGSWSYLPGGFLMQWGAAVVAPSGGSSAGGFITFPQPFSSVCQSITGNCDDGVSGDWRPMTVTFPGGPSKITGSGVQIDSTDSGHPITLQRLVYWKAIGQ